MEVLVFHRHRKIQCNLSVQYTLSFIRVLTNKNFCSPLSKMVEQNKSKIVQPALGENVCTSFFQFSFIVLCNKKVDKNTDAFLFHSQRSIHAIQEETFTLPDITLKLRVLEGGATLSHVSLWCDCQEYAFERPLSV